MSPFVHQDVLVFLDEQLQSFNILWWNPLLRITSWVAISIITNIPGPTQWTWAGLWSFVLMIILNGPITKIVDILHYTYIAHICQIDGFGERCSLGEPVLKLQNMFSRKIINTSNFNCLNLQNILRQRFEDRPLGGTIPTVLEPAREFEWNGSSWKTGKGWGTKSPKTTTKQKFKIDLKQDLTWSSVSTPNRIWGTALGAK